MVLSDYTKLRILSMHWRGYKISKIVDYIVLEDEIIVSRQSICLFLKCFKERGTIARKAGSGLTLKLSPAILQINESAMREDDETTATQLQARLATHGLYVSLATILHNRHQLGWIYRGLAYCQLIQNKSSWSGCVLILVIVLMMLFGVTNLASSCTVTDDTAVKRKEKTMP